MTAARARSSHFPTQPPSSSARSPLRTQLLLPLLLLACFSSTLLPAASAAPSRVRGLAPSQAQHYSGEAGTFTCAHAGGASITIPFNRINDDYCDCADGSDEPGTSACSKGRFYCPNKGHEPKLLATAFVDDGICDCCDGSDEAHVLCSNNCLDHSAPAFQALQQQVEAYGRALQARPTYVHRAEAKREYWVQRQFSVVNEIAFKKLKLDAALEGQAQAVKDNEQRLLAHRQSEEAKARARDVGQAGAVQEEVQHHVQEVEAQEQGEGAGAVQAEESVEERGRRIASQWTSDPAAAQGRNVEQEAAAEAGTDAAGGGAARPPPRSREARLRAGEQLSEWEQLLHFGDLVGGYFSGWSRWLHMVLQEGIKRDLLERRERARLRRQQLVDRFYSGGRAGRMRPPHAAGAWQQRLQEQVQPLVVEEPAEERSEELLAAERLVAQLQAELLALEREKHDGERFSTGTWDWGPDDVYFSFAGRCFEDVSHYQWTYELCFYDGAQLKGRTPGGQGPVSLGTWRGFGLETEEGEVVGESLVAMLDGGEACHGTLARSFNVRMECGEGDVLQDSSEASACSYVARFLTPAACTDTQYQRLLSSLAALEQKRAEIRAEIEGPLKHDEL